MSRTLDLNLTVYTPFLKPFPAEATEVSRFQAAMKDLCSLSEKLGFTSHFTDEIVPKIKVLEPFSSEEEQAKGYLETLASVRELGFPSPRTSLIVEFSTKVSVKDEHADMYDSESVKTRYEGEEAEQIYSLVIGNELLEHIHRLIIASNIAHVGALPSDKGILVSKNGLSSIEATSNAQSLEQAAEYALSIGWPPIKALSILEVWDWVSTKKGFMEGFGGGPTGRALNAFTHLLRPVGLIDESTELFWLLVGLEALYTKGNSGIQEQVREKSQLLLGPQDSYKKEISRMYNLRSRFVHGDLDFSGAHPSEAIGKYAYEQNQQLIKSVNLARAMLVSTLQTLVKNDWTEPRFYYQVEGSSGIQ